MADDRLTAYLAEVQERWSMAASMTWQDYETALELLAKALRSMADVPRLLSMVEAVLVPHQPGRNVVRGATCKKHESHRHFSITAAEAADIVDCKACRATVYTSCDGCGDSVSLDSCRIRSRIVWQLPGEELLRGYDDAVRGSAPAALSPCTRCNGGGSEPQSPPTPSSLTDRLAVIAADLDGYVERRVKEMTQPADRAFLATLRDTLSLVARDEHVDLTDARAVAGLLDRSSRAVSSLTMALDAFLAGPQVTPEALVDDARAILAGEDVA